MPADVMLIYIQVSKWHVHKIVKIKWTIIQHHSKNIWKYETQYHFEKPLSTISKYYAFKVYFIYIYKQINKQINKHLFHFSYLFFYSYLFFLNIYIFFFIILQQIVFYVDIQILKQPSIKISTNTCHVFCKSLEKALMEHLIDRSGCILTVKK